MWPATWVVIIFNGLGHLVIVQDCLFRNQIYKKVNLIGVAYRLVIIWTTYSDRPYRVELGRSGFNHEGYLQACSRLKPLLQICYVHWLSRFQVKNPNDNFSEVGRTYFIHLIHEVHPPGSLRSCKCVPDTFVTLHVSRLLQILNNKKGHPLLRMTFSII